MVTKMSVDSSKGKMCYNKNMHKKFVREGFTLIELTLSILFISVLSLAVALLITNAVTAYRRGIILNEVNTVGMEIVDDMRASVQGAQSRSLQSECASFYSGNEESKSECELDGAQKFVSVVKSIDNIKINGESIGYDVPIFGAFCTGSYSYIWNSGYLFNEEDYEVESTDRATLKYKIKEDEAVVTRDVKDFKLIKIIDENRNVCKSKIGGNYNFDDKTFSNEFDISGDRYGVLEEEPEDILTGDVSLALYDLTSMAIAESSVLNNSLYSTSFILGTVQGGININTTGNYCTSPEDYKSNFDYCAINKFNFAAQANGG